MLQFEDRSRKVKDASMQDEDTFEPYDPWNPVTKRRGKKQEDNERMYWFCVARFFGGGGDPELTNLSE